MKSIVKILIAILVAVAAGNSVDAQVRSLFPKVKTQRPDMAKIKSEITDRTSAYYYPRLMEEYAKKDTTMKLEKYRRLYLGFMFQEDYDPYRPSYPIPERVRELYGKEKPSRAECDSIIKYCELSLADNPLDMIQIQVLIQALENKGNKNLAKIWDYKLRYLLMAIVSTGTGLDKENAWYIVETQHEYVLLNQMGYRVEDHVFQEPNFEYITVRDADNRDSGGYYFNIGPFLGEYYRKHPEEL